MSDDHHHYWHLLATHSLNDRYQCIDCEAQYEARAMKVTLSDGRTFLARKPPAGHIVVSLITQGAPLEAEPIV